MGSDFTYDDLGDRHPSEDNHRLVRSETVNGEDCWVVESIPKDKNTCIPNHYLGIQTKNGGGPAGIL